jgi:transcriptional regulator with XRE-family HTH domain
MSPRSPDQVPRPSASVLADRVAATLGAAVVAERRRRGWTIREVALRARVAPATVHAVETGQRASIDMYARLAVALGLGLDVTLSAERAGRGRPAGDLVHAAMGEHESALLGRLGYEVAIDRPYQHYQFAGRADVLAWRRDPAALLHLENRTRFPDVQEAAGSFNAKCQYLAPELARQLGLRGFASVTHVIVGLWSAEVIHAVRLRPATFTALAPDDEARLVAWLSGDPPRAGVSRSLVLLDPFARGRQRAIVGLERVLGGERPRMRGYREAVDRLRARGLA